MRSEAALTLKHPTARPLHLGLPRRIRHLDEKEQVAGKGQGRNPACTAWMEAGEVGPFGREEEGTDTVLLWECIPARKLAAGRGRGADSQHRGGAEGVRSIPWAAEGT